LAQEAIRRPTIAPRIPAADSYRRLIAAERDPDRALALIDEARSKAKSAGESTAPWDLAELELHIASGNPEAARESLAGIERDHRDDPEVGAALYQLLYEAGILPDELPARPHTHTAEPVPAAVGSAEPPGGRIWTPDSERPASGKSAIWTPS
jgi:hypothetical protein